MATRASNRGVRARGSGGRSGRGNRGNAETLRRWYNGSGTKRGKRAPINWSQPGKGGRFYQCVAIAGKHMSQRHARGYCALRYREAVGHHPRGGRR